MSSTTVAEFAGELKMPSNVLLDQLRAAGVDLSSVDDKVTDSDKARLLESLRRAHGSTEGKKITLTRRQTSEIRQADGSGRSRTIQVEVRKKRTFVKRDTPEGVPARPEAEPAVSLMADLLAVLVRSLATPHTPWASTTQTTESQADQSGETMERMRNPAIWVERPTDSMREMPCRVASHPPRRLATTPAAS